MNKRTNSTRKIITWITILLLIGVMVYATITTVQYYFRKRYVISVGQTVFRADVAETADDRARGLSNRNTIGDKEALLLDFAENDKWPIIMKNMAFPIDVLWIDENYKVVDIQHELQPDAEPYTEYVPRRPARYVLEMQAGRARKSKIDVGTVLKLDVSKEGF